MAVCQSGQPIPGSTFCRWFIKSVRMMACVVCASHWEASHCIACITASTSMVRLEVGLRTGHNRLSYQLYSKLRIGHTEQCPCCTGSQTTEHLLQSRPIYEPLRKGIWPDPTPVARKLYGSLGGLRRTATLIEETGSFQMMSKKK